MKTIRIGKLLSEDPSSGKFRTQKGNNQRVLFFITILLCAFTVSGCGKTMLKDDFEKYAPGQAVGGSIPGSPEGDIIDVELEPGVDPDESLFSPSTIQPLNGDRSLFVREDVSFAHSFALIFVPVSPKNQTDDVVIHWTGRFVNVSQFSKILLEILQEKPGNNKVSVLRIVLNNEQLKISGGNIGTKTINGDFSLKHIIVIRIFPKDATYLVEVSEGGVNSESNSVDGNLDIPAMEIVPMKLRLRIKHLNIDHPGLDTYYKMDDIYFAQ